MQNSDINDFSVVMILNSCSKLNLHIYACLALYGFFCVLYTSESALWNNLVFVPFDNLAQNVK